MSKIWPKVKRLPKSVVTLKENGNIVTDLTAEKGSSLEL